jgi:hypothetical protein
MPIELRSSYGSIAGIERLIPEDVRNALEVKGKTLKTVLNHLPEQGDRLTEFESTSVGRALSFNDGGLSKLKSQLSEYLNHREGCFDFKKAISKLLKHSKIVILPDPAKPDEASPSILVNDSYYEDPEARNYDLVKIGSFLASEFGFLNFYLPDIRTKYTEGNKTLSLFGGHKVMKFLDFGSNEYNDKESLRMTFEDDDETSYLFRKMLDFSAASLNHNGSDTLRVRYPDFRVLNSLGVGFVEPSIFQDYQNAVRDNIVGPDGEIIARSASKVEQLNPSEDKPPLSTDDAMLAKKGKIKTLIAKNLHPETPAHIANLILSQDWIWSPRLKEALLLGSDKTFGAYEYDMTDIENFAHFYLSTSPIRVSSYSSGNDDHADAFNTAAQHTLNQKFETDTNPRLKIHSED